jgi:transcriptional regulator with XRE-family HTH domain
MNISRESQLLELNHITGREAFKRAVALLPDGNRWFKVGNAIFYRAIIKDGKIIEFAKTSKKGSGRRFIPILEDAYTYLRRESEKVGSGGVFFIPTNPSETPKKDDITTANFISVEFDGGSTEEQLAKLEWLTQNGFPPTLILGSGGKSIHAHWKTETLDIESRTQLQRKLTILVGSDPAVCTVTQPMRFPGFIRSNVVDGVETRRTEQPLLYCNPNNTYPLETLTPLIKSLYKARGLTYPESISDECFRYLKRRWDDLTKDDTQLEAVLTDATIYTLPKSYKSLSPKPPKPPKTKTEWRYINSSTNIDNIGIDDPLVKKILIGAIAHIQSCRREDNTYQSIWLPLATALKQLFGENEANCILSHVGGKVTDWGSILRTAAGNYFDDPIRVILAKAKQLGFNLKECFKNDKPKIEWSEPNPDDYNRYVEQQETQAAIDEISEKHYQQERTEHAQKQFEQLIAGIESAIEYELEAEYKPDVDIWFKRGDRLKAYQQAYNQGYKYALDNSWMGLGKDHDNSNRHPDPEITIPGVDGDGNPIEKTILPKIWLIDQDYKNKDSDFDSWDVLAPRHNGLYEDDSRQTDKGRSYLVTKPQQQNQIPSIPANCHRADLFADTRAKGIPGLQESVEVNPICLGCEHFHSCRNEGTPGGSYLTDRQSTIKSSRRLLAHSQNLPRNYDYRHDAIIVNEAGNILNSKKIIKASRKDWGNAIAFSLSNPNLTPTEKELLLEINEHCGLLYEDNTKNGLDLDNIRQKCAFLTSRDASIWQALADKINDYQALKYSELLSNLKDLDSVTKEGAKELSNSERAIVRHYYKKQQVRDIRNQIKDFPQYFLGDLLKILLGATGYVTYRHGNITVTTRDTDFIEILKRARKVTFLDSTLTRERLAKLLNVDVSEICVVAQEGVSMDNLKISRFELEGDASNDLSANYLERLGKMIAHFKSTHNNAAAIVPLARLEAVGGDMGYMSQTRGANLFKGKHLLIKPVLPDMGAIKADFYLECPGASLEEFNSYYKQRQLDELIQTIGRNRWHWYKEQLEVWLCLPAAITARDIRERGLPCDTLPIVETCLEAAPKRLQNPLRILKAILTQVKKGVKITQAYLAAKLGIHQSNVSRVFKKLNVDYKALIKLCESLYISIKGKRINFDSPPPELDDIAHLLDFEPELLIEQILEAWFDKGFSFIQTNLVDKMTDEYRESLWQLLFTSAIAYRVDNPPPLETST